MSTVYIRVRLEDGTTHLIGPMDRRLADLTLYVMARGWIIDGQRVVSAVIVPEN